jgi:hypothetical protein
MKRKRREEAVAMLAEMGFEGNILTEEEVEVLVDELLTELMPEFGNRSIIELVDETINEVLDYCLYVGYTVQRIRDEAFAFMGRRAANRPKKKNGATPLNRPVLLHGLVERGLSVLLLPEPAREQAALHRRGVPRRAAHEVRAGVLQ